MSKEFEEVPGGQKRVSKEEQGGRWGQRKRQRPENVGLVKIPSDGFAFLFLLT